MPNHHLILQTSKEIIVDVLYTLQASLLHIAPSFNVLEVLVGGSDEGHYIVGKDH